MPKADRQLTNAKRFQDPRSYVTANGDEVLYGEDWDERRFELLQRSHGQCEYLTDNDGEMIRCSRDAEDPHHKILRSVKRRDNLDGLLAVCRIHHRILDFQQRKERHKR